MIQKIKKVINKITYSGMNTYSQAGEDVIIDFLLQGIGLHKLSYLDLGTNVPDWGNNTYLFYKRGGKGVLVEADETIIPLIKKIRPNDKILNIGVGLGNQKEADFYIFENNGLNTFSREEAECREREGKSKIKKITKVPLKPINEIIAENFDGIPDFLSIDIEGLDLPVLKTLDFNKYPISIICAETCTFSENHIKPKDNLIANFLLSKDYFIYADTYINTIFVNNKWFNSVMEK
jgi:FkbM family methyltransferase